ncbi:MAG TPA: DUF397 domain-containing protein [Pseudonocardiaceae bacterium]|nr:DUF397 domain-containing protein [Pseudonocardiaceae bacterium]
MTTVPTGQATWRKSSRSGQDTNCVEVCGTLDAVRDSKNPAGPVLRADAVALVAAVKGGRLGA